jgi:hypothetical protein
MAKQNSYALDDVHTYAANAVTRVRLPLSGYITHIDAVLVANATATGVVAPNEDPYGRLIRSMRIRASGARSFVDFSDGRQWQYYNHFQYRGQLQADALPTGVTAAADYRALFPIHLGTFPSDVFDTSVPIPAVETTDLVMEITWGTGLDLAPANLTLNSARLELTVYEIALAPGEKRSLIWKKGLVVPRFEPRIIPVTASFANLGLTDDLPVGDTLHRTVLMFMDTSVDPRGVRSNALVNRVGVRFPKLRETPWERETFQFVAESQRKYDLAAPVVGAAQLDGMQLSGRAVGLDLTKAVTGDAQNGFTTTIAGAVTGGQIHAMHYLMS